VKGVWRILFGPVVLGTLALLAWSAIVWWIGPLVAIGSLHPLDGVWARVIVIALSWSLWLGRLAWLAWRRKRANAALLAGISAGPSAADREAQVLAQRFAEAVDKLKAAGRGRAWWQRGDSLYELPWYMFIGAPGSGKTTALLNAGLNFVLDDGRAVRGVGGTRNCDWWFTRDAVLIDTAGRYSLQDSEREVDAAAWERFLALLRKTRPRRPINGVLLTVSVQDLLQQGTNELAEHAAKLRARLQELQARLGVRPPVYVLVTKADLIAGFNETFDALGKEERDQVWGFTFPLERANDEPLNAFDTEYRLLEERLNGSLIDRLQAERDPSRRAAIFGFGNEFAALKPLLGEFLAKVFEGSKLEDRVNLRGVYFTSGTQEGTPIDRAMAMLARSFKLERRTPAPAAGRGKSFFLRRLMQDLVFPEAHLVSFNPAAERRRTMLRVAGFASIALLSAALLACWAVSHMRNKAYEQEVAARVPGLQQSVAALPATPSGDPTPVVPVLASVHDAAKPSDFRLDNPPLLNTLGLYLGDKLDAGAQIGYRKLLEHAFAPRIARRLEERLRAANKDNLEQAYEALKAYLMLYTPDKFDAASLKAWIGIDWDAQFRSMPPEQRRALDQQLDALLALGAPPPVVPADQALVSSVRDLLASYPLEYRIYSRLKRQFRGELPEFTVAGSAGPNAPRVFERASGEPLSRGVAGFYTRDGYVKAFQASVTQLAAQLASEEQWVLGRSSGGARSTAANLLGNELGDRVRRLYLQDYIKTWDAFLADVRLVRLGSLERSMEVARLLSSVDSPLTAYLRAVTRETTLVPPPSQPGAIGQLAQQAQQARNDLAKLADPQAAPTQGGSIERMVDDHFAYIHRMFQGTPPKMEDLQKSFGDAYAQLQAIDEAQKSKSPPPAGAAAKIKPPAGDQPEVVRSIFDSLADAGARQGRSAEVESLKGELKPVYDFCTRAISNRYPFASGSRADVLPEDFGQLFGVGGMLDDFYQKRLAALVDTGTNPWSYKPLTDGTRPATPASLADFQRAARIKEAFFRSGGKAPGFRLDIRPVDFPDGLKEVSLDVDGQVYKLAAANPQPVTLTWPSTRVASQIRLIGAPDSQPTTFEGPWALFRMFDRFEVQPTGQPEKFNVLLNLDGKRVKLEVTSNSVLNPFRMREIQQFRCPGAL
jgi:type VI secretion system protein ImpL